MAGPSLPYRPAPLEGESWPGYLLRISNANGLRGLGAVAQLRGVTAEVLLAEEALDLATFLGIDCSELRGKVGLYRGHLNMGTRICPLCLQEDQQQFIRASWDSPIKLECEVHRLLLQDRCPVCGHALTYRRRSQLNACNCGSRLSSWPCVWAEPWIFEMHRMMRAEEYAQKAKPTFGDISLDEKAKTRVLLLLKLFQEKRNSQDYKIRTPRRKFITAENASALRVVFEDGRRTVSALFTEVRRRGLNSERLGLIKGTYLYEIWRDGMRDRKRADRLEVASRVSASEAPAFVSKKRVMRDTGLHPTAVDYLIRQGVLHCIKLGSPQRHAGAILIPVQEHQRLMATLNESMSITQVAASEGVKNSLIRVLGYSGVVPTFKLGRADFVFRIKAAEWNKFSLSILSRTRHSRRGFESLISMEHAFVDAYRYGQGHLRQLLTDVQSGALTSLRTSKEAAQLSGCFLERRAYLRWCDQMQESRLRLVNAIPY